MLVQQETVVAGNVARDASARAQRLLCKVYERDEAPLLNGHGRYYGSCIVVLNFCVCRYRTASGVAIDSAMLASVACLGRVEQRVKTLCAVKDLAGAPQVKR